MLGRLVSLTCVGGAGHGAGEEEEKGRVKRLGKRAPGARGERVESGGAEWEEEKVREARRGHGDGGGGY